METANNRVKIYRCVPLNTDLKRRLLKSIQAGKLNLSQFPEFDEFGNYATEIDISDFTDEEKIVLLKVARRL